ncbi:aldo/keto reductase family protein [Leifsonia shinshuensis]|uniref:Aryl-alcohol dehydrogenase-like predicted oxidoreductase n=1 Tax=Leifsonia shinshuensis TaxID=150026 RepID=A0A853CV47_9MICO|nr:aldo/keto reductase family protein [Leifsonia shinshuensis]NYJ24288.1 aryl-alcohol dehydrogenase-like predicted oxidoreductase [Leifsonia shinshuensis]
MEFRYLGDSGLKISEIIYGNWLTHASQVENETATQCVHAALDAGISTFDTADAYANTAAEQVLGDALKGQRRQSLEIFTKVYWPTGPKGHNDTGLSRKHILESIEGSLTRLGTDYVDLYQAHRFDYETPLEETMQAFADVVRQGKALYIGVSEWTGDQLRAGHALAKQLGFQLISNQPQYSMLWRVIEKQVVPASAELGISQIVWSPVAQGVLTGKYLPGAPLPEGSRAADEKGGANAIKDFLRDDVLSSVQRLKPIADELGLTMAQLAVAWVLQNPNVSGAIVGASRPEQVASNAAAAGVRLSGDVLARIDEAVGDVAVTDPAETVSPASRVA